MEQSTTKTDTEVLEPTFADYYKSVIDRKWLVLLVFILVSFIGVVYTIRQPKIYEAVATVEIDLQADRVLNDVNDVYQLGDIGYWDNKSYFETQYKIIQSRTIAAKVVEKLHLDRDLVFLGLDTIEDETELSEKLTASDPIEILRQGLIVDPFMDSRLVRIRYRGVDPEKITTISNALVAAYIEQNLDRKLSSTRNALEWLNSQLGDLKGKLEISENNLYNFLKENDILSTSMDQKTDIVGTRLVQLNGELGRYHTKQLLLKSEYESLQGAVDGSQSLENIASAEIVRNPLIKELKITIERLHGQYADLLSRYKERHPDVIRIKSQLDRAKENLQREVKNIIEAKRLEYFGAKKTMAAIQQEMEKVKQHARLLTLKEVEYNRLLRDKQSNLHVFEQVLSRAKEIDLSSMMRVNNIRMLDAAMVPDIPVLPRVRINIIISVLLGLLLGLGAAILLELFDKTLRNTEDVERFLKLPLLGILPEVKIKQDQPEAAIPNAAEILSFLKPKSSIAECCRQVRTNISFMSPGKPISRVLVTSSSPREGKTTIVSNLGITMANSGRRVLVLDTDMRRPRIHKAFRVSNEYGLSNVIMGTMKLEDAILKTEIENLELLTCGPIPPNPAELIGSDEFEKLVDRLSEIYDWIIFDSPPVIAVTDSLILSKMVDGVVLVVKFGSTHREVAAQARKHLTDVNANILGAVINNLDLDSKEYGNYYYYYHQRYGYYYSEKENEG